MQIDGGNATAGCNGQNLCKPKNISFSTLQRKKAFLYERRGYHMVGPAGLIANHKNGKRDGGLCDGEKMRYCGYAILRCAETAMDHSANICDGAKS